MGRQCADDGTASRLFGAAAMAMLYADGSPCHSVAAFDDRQADVLVHAGVSNTLSSKAETWPRFTRAIALRET